MHEPEPVADFLRTVAPFDTLAPDELRAAARRFEAAYYPRGKHILDSSPVPGLAVIRKGAVRLLDAEGRFLDKRSEGEVFGHRTRFRGGVTGYRAEAEEDALVWHLSPEAFADLCARHRGLAAYFEDQARTRLSAAAQARGVPFRVSDLPARPVVSVETTVTVREAAECMSRQRVSSVLVTQAGVLAGILTDRDLRQRVLAAGRDSRTAVGDVMTPAPFTLCRDDNLDDALLLMMRRNCHHLPIVDGDRPVGVVTAGDLLREHSEHPLRLVRDIHRSQTVDDLALLRVRLPDLFLRVAELGRDARHTGEMLTLLTDAFTVRLLQLAEHELGSPPMPYAWLAFGSQARGEQSFRSDQDNGLVLERQPEPPESEYFSRMGDLVCTALDRIGYRYCPGEVMALNAQWRVALDQWKRYFDGWIEQPDLAAVMRCSIFFDLRFVAGSPGLAAGLADHAIARAAENRIFLRFMAENVLSHRPPIGFFRRFVQEEDGSHSEGLNLKHRGVVPIVDLARLRALEAGVAEPGTFRRLERVASAGLMNPGDAGSLRDALALISGLRLEWQAQQLRGGEEPGHLVPPDRLSPLMRRNLRAAFMEVVEAQRALAGRYRAA